MNKEAQLYHNQWNIQFHFERLDQDFYFYTIINKEGHKEFNSVCTKIPLYWSQVLNLKIISGQAFFLLKKSDQNPDFLDEISVFFGKIPIDIFLTKSYNVFYQGRYPDAEKNFFPLKCLILGILPRLSDRNGWGQIDGHTCFFLPKKEGSWHRKNSIMGVMIEPLFENNRFNLRARNFAKLTEFNREKTTKFYIWEDKKGILKQIKNASIDMNEKVFSNRAVPSMRASVNHLDLKSHTDFLKSKTGILYSFMEEMKTHMSDYMTVTISTMDDVAYSSAKRASNKNKKLYTDYFSGKTIYLIDLVKTSESKDILSKTLELLTTMKGCEEINFQYSDDVREGYNIALLHNLEYYQFQEESNVEDPYLVMQPGKIIQHITIEDFNFLSTNEKQKETLLFKLFHELILKEVNDQKQLNELTLLDFFNTDDIWTFGCYVREQDSEYGLCVLKIAKGGVLEYIYYSSDNVKNRVSPLLVKLENLRCKRKKPYDKYENYSKVAGFVMKNEHSLAMIYETDMTTIADYQYIHDILLDTKTVDKDVSTAKLKEVVYDFLEENPHHPNIQKGKLFYEHLLKLGYIEKVGLIKEGYDLRGNPSIFKAINEEIHNKLGYYIWPPIRTVEYQEVYRNLLNINLFRDSNSSGLNFYFAGFANNISNSPVARTTRMREFLVSGTPKLQFKEIVKLFDIDMVRNGSMTVYPFPFKLIREHTDNLKRINTEKKS
ncbi:hypothetical protein [Enterococcus innesii]|uniref:hypothetical protein n=1 Tax=Enterococcus TaxID=1350 RepID=UPI0018990595